MHIVHMETLTYFTDPIIPNSKVNISKVLTQFQDSTVPREQRNIDTLLEKYPWVPVESALWYRFLEPVHRKRYQRLEPLVPGKTTGTYG